MPSSHRVRPIRAQVGEVVDIAWRNTEGEILHVRYLAPPPSTWKARVEVEKEGT